MKTNLVRMVLLLVAVWPFNLRSADMNLVVSTYQKGSNITEPRPAESEYLRATLGGFHLIQDMAGFKLFKGIKTKSVDGEKQLTAPPSAEPPHSTLGNRQS